MQPATGSSQVGTLSPSPSTKSSESDSGAISYEGTNSPSPRILNNSQLNTTTISNLVESLASKNGKGEIAFHTQSPIFQKIFSSQTCQRKQKSPTASTESVERCTSLAKTKLPTNQDLNTVLRRKSEGDLPQQSLNNNYYHLQPIKKSEPVLERPMDGNPDSNKDSISLQNDVPTHPPAVQNATKKLNWFQRLTTLIKKILHMMNKSPENKNETEKITNIEKHLQNLTTSSEEQYKKITEGRLKWIWNRVKLLFKKQPNTQAVAND